MAGIYIHIPFCKQKCSYCDFHFSTTFTAYREKMISALLEEIETRVDYIGGQNIETIYFGGGTPSLLTEEELKAIRDCIYKNYTVLPEIEFTLEANPDDINEEQLLMWKSQGINRLSMGVQSFFQEDLDWMNRVHTVEEGIQSIELAKAYEFSLNADLIYGLPNHTLEKLSQNIQKMVSLEPDHISAYCLTVSEGTALNKMIQNNLLPAVGEDEQAEEFEMIVKELAAAGYEQYEISNFAREDAYSRHNTNYWLGAHYLGIGPSAHSFDGESRRWNVSNNSLYIKGIPGDEYYTEEILTPKDRFNESLLTGLRTKWGVNLEDLFFKHCASPDFTQQLNEFKKLGLITEKEGHLFLTEKGKLQADHIAAMLFII